MATSPPLTSTRPQGHSDWTTQTPWATGSSYPRSPRYEVKHISNQNRLLSIFRAKCTTMPTKRTWRLWTSFLGSQQYMVSSLQPYTEIIGEWVKMGVFRTYRLNILFQNTKGCQRWLGWTSSLALAASVDFAWGSVLCLLPSCSTGSPSNSAGISNFDREKNFYLSSFI